jgi:hypothetical protein
MYLKEKLDKLGLVLYNYAVILFFTGRFSLLRENERCKK